MLQDNDVIIVHQYLLYILIITKREKQGLWIQSDQENETLVTLIWLEKNFEYSTEISRFTVYVQIITISQKFYMFQESKKLTTSIWGLHSA